MPFAKTSDVHNEVWSATSATTIACTLPTANSGDFIFVWVTADSGTLPTITVADPTNGAYQAKLSVNNVGDQIVQQFYFVNSAAASSLVITATYSVSRPFRAIYAAAWSGADTSVGFDVEDGQYQSGMGTGTDEMDSTNQTTTAADLIIGTALGLNNVDHVIGTGFSSDLSLDLSAAARIVMENKVQGAAGSDHSTFTPTVTSGQSFTMFMAVKPAGAGGGGTYGIHYIKA